MSEIEKVDAYLTGSEQFSSANLIGSVNPSAATFDIPVTISQQLGIAFICLSIVLKPTVALNNSIELHKIN